MKYSIAVVLFCCFFCANVYSQDVIRLAACKEETISKQADSLKEAFSKLGFVVAKEATVAMESEFEMSVMVALTEGSWYQFIFIGDPASKLYETRMFDSDDKQVVYQKKLNGDQEWNIISFSYIPKFSEFYAIRPVQVNKKNKHVCGHVILMKKIK